MEENKIEQHQPVVRKKKLNTWKISSIVLGLLLIISLAFSGNGFSLSGPSGNAVAETALDFINTNLLQGQTTATMGDVTEEEGLYKAGISVMGQETDVYMTKNGNLLFLQAIDMTQEIEIPEQQSPPPATYSEEDLIEITKFSNCLSENELKVYAAGWCGHCKNLVEYFGGKSTMESIYIECQDEQGNPTENTNLCEEEKITGFPTIKINGEPYNNARTFEALAEATSCPVPKLNLA